MEQGANMERAYQVYFKIVDHLNKINWKFDRHDNDLIITSGIKGDDVPISFLLIVKPKNEVIQFLSLLPFKAPEDKRIDFAIAVNVANYGLVDGSFDYDIGDGEIRYRLTCSYRGNTVEGDLIDYIIAVASATVDNYNDKFLMLSDGTIDIEQFIKKEEDGD